MTKHLRVRGRRLAACLILLCTGLLSGSPLSPNDPWLLVILRFWHYDIIRTKINLFTPSPGGSKLIFFAPDKATVNEENKHMSLAPEGRISHLISCILSVVSDLMRFPQLYRFIRKSGLNKKYQV